MAIEKKDVQKTNLNIIKAENIISELRSTLNPQIPVSLEFDLMYDYIYRRLIDANINKDTKILEETLGYIRELRDTWKEAMKLV